MERGHVRDDHDWVAVPLLYYCPCGAEKRNGLVTEADGTVFLGPYPTWSGWPEEWTVAAEEPS